MLSLRRLRLNPHSKCLVPTLIPVAREATSFGVMPAAPKPTSTDENALSHSPLKPSSPRFSPFGPFLSMVRVRVVPTRKGWVPAAIMYPLPMAIAVVMMAQVIITLARVPSILPVGSVELTGLLRV